MQGSLDKLGYPDFMMNDAAMDNLYSSVSTCNTDRTLLLNEIKIRYVFTFSDSVDYFCGFFSYKSTSMIILETCSVWTTTFRSPGTRSWRTTWTSRRSGCTGPMTRSCPTTTPGMSFWSPPVCCSSPSTTTRSPTSWTLAQWEVSSLITSSMASTTPVCDTTCHMHSIFFLK